MTTLQREVLAYVIIALAVLLAAWCSAALAGVLG